MRVFIACTVVVASALVVCCALVVTRQWFVGDDFAFLGDARSPRSWRSWARVFLPIGPRSWWSYRPLTIEVFWATGWQLFGHQAAGYLAVSVLAHLLTGALVYRLARQLGFDSRIALVTGLLSVSRYPSLNEGFWISVAQYTIAVFLCTLTAVLFLSYARTARIAHQYAACLTFSLALLSNEFSVTLCGMILLLSLYPNDFRIDRAVLWRALPYLVLAAAYLVFRLKLIGPAAVPGTYTARLGWHALPNAGWLPVYVFGQEAVRLWAVLGVVLALLALAAIAGAQRRAAFTWFWRAGVVCVAWFVLTLVPYAILLSRHPRFAIPLEVPVCLLIGACGHAFGVACRRPAIAGWILLVLCVASVPYEALARNFRHPAGRPTRQFVEVIRAHRPDSAGPFRVVVLYGGAGLALESDTGEFRRRLFGAAALGVFFPGERDEHLMFWDLRHGPPPAAGIASIVLALRPGLLVEPARADAF